MYCPNCGEKQNDERTSACANCGLPLAEVAGVLARNHGPVEKREAENRASRDRLIAGAVFFGLAAIPIGLGIKNSLQAATPKPRFDALPPGPVPAPPAAS